jgi:hypothetical protein
MKALKLSRFFAGAAAVILMAANVVACGNSGGDGGGGITQPPAKSPGTLTLSASSSVPFAGTATISAAMTHCASLFVSGGQYTAQAYTAPLTTSALTSTTAYTGTCTGDDGKSVTSTATTIVASLIDKTTAFVSWGDTAHIAVNAVGCNTATVSSPLNAAKSDSSGFIAGSTSLSGSGSACVLNWAIPNVMGNAYSEAGASPTGTQAYARVSYQIPGGALVADSALVELRSPAISDAMLSYRPAVLPLGKGPVNVTIGLKDPSSVKGCPWGVRNNVGGVGGTKFSAGIATPVLTPHVNADCKTFTISPGGPTSNFVAGSTVDVYVRNPAPGGVTAHIVLKW